MADERHKNGHWRLPTCGRNGLTWNHAQVAVLMDIRDELQEMNRTLRGLDGLARCPNVSRGFRAMQALQRKLAPTPQQRREQKKRK